MPIRTVQNRPRKVDPVVEQLLSVERLSNATLNLAAKNTKAVFDAIWNNPDPECTPARMFEEMGTHAVANLTSHYHMCQALAAAGYDVSAYSTPPVKYTAHQDGTITLD